MTMSDRFKLKSVYTHVRLEFFSMDFENSRIKN